MLVSFKAAGFRAGPGVGKKAMIDNIAIMAFEF